MANFGNGGRPQKYHWVEVALDDMEMSRLYENLCICETVDVKPQVFEREPSLEYQPLERRALDAVEICHTATNKCKPPLR